MDALSPEMLLFETLEATHYVVAREINGDHRQPPGGYCGRFADEHGMLFFETASTDWWRREGVSATLQKRVRTGQTKRIATYRSREIPIHAPVVPADGVTVSDEPWGWLSELAQATAWAASWRGDEPPVVVSCDTFSSFADSDGAVIPSSLTPMPEDSHGRVSVKLADLFCSALRSPVFEGDVRFLTWATPFAAYLRAEHAHNTAATTLVIYRREGADPRVGIVAAMEKGVRVCAEASAGSIVKALGDLTDDEKAATLLVDAGGLSIRCGRLAHVAAAQSLGRGSFTLSNRLLHDAVKWLGAGRVRVVLPLREGDPLLLTDESRGGNALILPWG